MSKHQEKKQSDLGPKPIVSRMKQNKGCVSHWGFSIYIKKYLKAKEGLWKLKYFIMQKHNLQKNPLKEKKILQAM
jgi:hypothetical protein